jgi:hypothetical protein
VPNHITVDSYANIVDHIYTKIKSAVIILKTSKSFGFIGEANMVGLSHQNKMKKQDTLTDSFRKMLGTGKYPIFPLHL